MQSRGKPFVVYRKGTGFVAIVPRGFNGWAQFAAWLAMLVPLCWWFFDQMRTARQASDPGVTVIVFVLGLIGWAACLTWWMLARSETVDLIVRKRDAQRARRKNDRVP